MSSVFDVLSDGAAEPAACDACGRQISPATFVPSARSVKQLRGALLESVLAAYQEEYRDAAERWKNLETKAQGTVAIAGIFVAGILAFIRPSDAMTLRPAERVLLAVAISTFAGAVVCAAAALILRARDSVPSQLVEKMAADLRRDTDEGLVASLDGYLFDQIEAWTTVNTETRRTLAGKAQALAAGQALLIVGVLLFAAVAAGSVFVPRNQAASVQQGGAR